MLKFNRLIMEKVVLYSITLILFIFYFINYSSNYWLVFLFLVFLSFHIFTNYYTEKKESNNQRLMSFLELLIIISILLLIFNKIPTSL